MEEAYVKQQNVVESEHHQREDHKHDLLKSEQSTAACCLILHGFESSAS